MPSTVTRQKAREIHKVFDKVWDAGWFQKKATSLNLQDYSLESMHQDCDIWFPVLLVYWFASHPEGETSRYKWVFRQVDQLRNLYVWRK